MPSLENSDPERDRICAALVALVAERGFPEVTLEALLQRAGTDRAGFERHFADLGQCFAAVWEECKDELVSRTSTAYFSAAGWREGMRRAAWAFCRWIQEDHGRARILLVDISSASEMVVATRDFVMEAYVDLIDEGDRERPPGAPPVPRVEAEAIMGAIWQGAAAKTKAEAFEGLPAVIPEAMYLTVFRYLGHEAAQEELRRGPEDIARYERGEL